MTLILAYEDSIACQRVLDYLPELHELLASEQIHIVVAKMRKNDGPRWLYQWKAHHLPYFRFYVGEQVSSTLRAYPEIETIFDWITNIYKTHLRIIEVNSQILKERFLSEPNAFYLRYDPKRENYYDMLTKFQMVDKNMRVYYATNPAFDVFDNNNPGDLVIGFKRSFEEPMKFLSSADKLNADNIQRFFHSYREPSIVELNEDLLNSIVTNRIRTAFYFGKKSESVVREAFKFVAFEQKSNILFVIVGEEERLLNELMTYMEVFNLSEDEIRVIEYDGSDFRVFEIEGKSVAEIAGQFEKFNNKELLEIHERETVMDQTWSEL